MQFDQMLSRYQIITRKPYAPFVAMPNYRKFLDCRHGELAIGYGTNNEYEEE